MSSGANDSHVSTSSSYLKAQKFVASKMSNSVMGRKFLLQYVGEEGDNILQSLKNAVRKVSDQETGKTLKADALLLISKVALLYQAKKVTNEDLMQTNLAILTLVNLVIDDICLDNDTKDVGAFRTALQDVEKAVLPVIQPVMKEKNWSKLTSIFGYYASPAFLEKFLLEGEFDEDRRALQQNFEVIARPYETKLNASFSTLKQNVLPVLSVEACLYNDASLSKFQEYLVECSLTDETHKLQFAKAVQDYRQLTNAKTRSSRADTIFAKFIAPNAASSIGADAEMVGAIQTLVDSDRFPKDLFNGASDMSKKSLEASFQKHLAHHSAKMQREDAEANAASEEVITNRLDMARRRAAKTLEDMRSLSS